MKCKHDACLREATVNGYCNKCIQLPTRECEHCNGTLPENRGWKPIAAEVRQQKESVRIVTRIPEKPWWQFW